MSTTTNYITSPKGEIQFLALNRKVAKDLKPDSPEGYAIRLKLTTKTKEGAAFKAAVEAINPNLIGTKHVDNKDEYTVRAFSKYMPEVLDNNGNTLEELPNFYKSSKGVATMVVTPYTGNAMGGTINLVGVVIHSLEEGEREETEGNGEGSGAREQVLSKLRAALEK